jgi:hypothetical protein
MPPNEWTFSHYRPEYESETGIIGSRGSRPKDGKWWNHMPAALIKEQLGNERWASYFKFCVIRNPYDKAISLFYYDRFRNNAPVESANLIDHRTELENWLQSSKLIIDRNKYLIDGQFCLDAVIRYETLATDLEKICARLGLPWKPDSLPSLKAGVRMKNFPIESLYTEKSRQIVASAYSFELDYFGYSFPSSIL